MNKALIVKLGALESCSPAASADFGMIGGTVTDSALTDRTALCTDEDVALAQWG